MKLITKTLLCFIVVISTHCYAWNNVAHMVIAKIAYERLNPEARMAVDYMTADLRKEYPDIKSFLQLASWPDTLRTKQKIGVFNHWHYIDTPFSQDSTPLRTYFYPDNIVWAINQIEPLVANRHTNAFERVRFLAFLIHLVGDIHQPLHVSSRFSVQHPKGDLGGNLFLIQSPTDHTKTISLHKFWDDGLGLFDITASMTNINLLSLQISTDFPEQYFGEEIHDLVIKNWVEEGFNTANIVVYATPENKTPSDDYIKNGKQISEKVIALSGYRLAYLLNILLG